MSVAKNQVIAALTPPLPLELSENIVKEYLEIKQNFAFRRFRPSELNGGRFAECILRLLQHVDNPPFTPFGVSLGNKPDVIVNRALQNTSLHDSMRFYIPRLAKILLDIRNRRDVAHVGGDVSPNLADAQFISHTADWVLTEVLRIYYSCTIDTAKKISESINEFRVPIIADIDGHLRVQNTGLDYKQKTLAILYHKSPTRVSESALVKWTRYSNPTEYRKNILARLDADALIHYEKGVCTLLPKGIIYTEKYVPMELLV